jgi:hypothetical protein
MQNSLQNIYAKLEAVLHRLQQHAQSKVSVEWLSTILDGSIPTKSGPLQI